MLEIDGIQFINSNKKGRTEFPIVIRCYAIRNKKGLEEVMSLKKSVISSKS